MISSFCLDLSTKISCSKLCAKRQRVNLQAWMDCLSNFMCLCSVTGHNLFWTSTGVKVNVHLIKLIPNGTCKDTISGWQPVNLLNVSYKVLSKALAFRTYK